MTHIRTRGRAALLAGAIAVAAIAPALAGCAQQPDTAAGADAATAPAQPGLDLRAAPWTAVADVPNDIAAAPEQPSLVFAPGVTYPEALRRVYVAARAGSPQVEGAAPAPPLPREVVYVAPAGAGDGLRLSLLAPWGWMPATGAIRPPSIALPGDLPPAEVMRRVTAARERGEPLPEGATVDAPDLPACQVGAGAPDRRPPC